MESSLDDHMLDSSCLSPHRLPLLSSAAEARSISGEVPDDEDDGDKKSEFGDTGDSPDDDPEATKLSAGQDQIVACSPASAAEISRQPGPPTSCAPKSITALLVGSTVGASSRASGGGELEVDAG